MVLSRALKAGKIWKQRVGRASRSAWEEGLTGKQEDTGSGLTQCPKNAVVGRKDTWIDLRWVLCVAPYRVCGATVPLPSSQKDRMCLDSGHGKVFRSGHLHPSQGLSALCLGGEAPPQR